MSANKTVPSATIKDVAKLASVSIGTVSRVMNNSANVDRTLRDRVEEAIKELQYRPAQRAQSRIKDPSATISFILSNRAYLNPVHAYILQGVEDYCAEAGYFVLFARHSYSGVTPARDLPIPKILSGHRLADCVIVAGANSDNFLDLLDGLGVKYVVLENNLTASQMRNPVNQVRYDDQAGVYEATRYLIQLGHRSIWFIGDVSRLSYQRRYESYLRALQESKLEAHAQTMTLCDDPFENGRASMGMILEQRQPVTALVAASDELALGAMEVLRQHGREIPRDVSVIGFDYQVCRSRVSDLTAVCVDSIEVGRQLAKFAIARIQSGGRDAPEVVVPAFLMKRGTCRPLRPDQQMLL